MRFTRVEVDSFGRLSGLRLSPGPGLNLVLGPNEAGKSTLRAFLERMLFGFPDRRARALPRFGQDEAGGGFGGRVELADDPGVVLSIERRPAARRKAARLAARRGDEALSEDDLAGLLGLGPAAYQALFSLDTGRLVDLAGEEVHAELLSAGLASARSPVEVEADLARDAEALYKPRGRKQPAARLARELAALRRELDGLADQEDEYRAALAAATEAERALEAARGEAERARAEADRAGRARDALEPLAALEAARAAQAAAEAAGPLGAEVGRELERLGAAAEVAAARLAEAGDAQRAAEAELDEVPETPWSASLEAALRDLQARREVFREARHEARAARRRVEHAGAEVSRLVAALGLAEADLGAVDASPGALARCDQAQRELDEVDHRWAAADAAAREAEAELSRLRRDEGVLRAELGSFWSGSLDPGVVDQTRAALGDLQEGLRRADEDRRALEDCEAAVSDHAAAARREQGRAEAEQPPATLGEDLVAVAGLGGVFFMGRALVGSLASAGAWGLTPTGGGALVAGAGLLGWAVLRVRRARSAARYRAHTRAREEAEVAAGRARDRAAALRARVQEAEAAVAAARRALGPFAAEVAAGEGDRAGLSRARDCAARAAELAGRLHEATARVRAQREVADAARRARGQLDEEAGGAEARWREVVHELGLPGEPSPARAREMLRQVGEARGHLEARRAARDEALVLEARVAAFDQAARALAREVLGDDALGEDPDLLEILGLVEVDHEVAAGEQAARQEAQRRLRGARERAAREAAAHAGAHQALAAALAEAGAADLEEARRRVAAGEDLARAQDEVVRLEAQLARLAGASWRDELAEVEGADRPSIEARRARALDAAERHDARARAALEARGAARAEAARLATDEDRAQALGEQGELVARAGELAGRWAVLRLAGALSRRLRARHARGRQPEALARAGRALEAITEGRWRGLEVDQGAVLAVDHEGRRWPARDLSQGTRDALYLAHRFGLLDELADARGLSLPVLLDDVLVHLDPGRAHAVAGVLAELATRHQIFVFTCAPSTAEVLRAHAPDLVELSW